MAGDGGFEDSKVGELIVFEGYECLDQFCNFSLDKENYGSTVIAHNQGGYAGKFILKWLVLHCRPPNRLIQQGNRLSFMSIRKNKLRFVDSLNFFLCSLSKLSDMSVSYTHLTLPTKA